VHGHRSPTLEKNLFSQPFSRVYYEKFVSFGNEFRWTKSIAVERVKSVSCVYLIFSTCLYYQYLARCVFHVLFLVHNHLLQLKNIHEHVSLSSTANPTLDDIFECCFKAQSSKLERLFSLKRGKRDVRALSFELSKMTPQVGLAVHTILIIKQYLFYSSSIQCSLGSRTPDVRCSRGVWTPRLIETWRLVYVRRYASEWLVYVAILVVVVGVEYSFRNCQVVPMGKNAGANQLKFFKTLGQTLGLDT